MRLNIENQKKHLDHLLDRVLEAARRGDTLGVRNASGRLNEAIFEMRLHIATALNTVTDTKDDAREGAYGSLEELF